MAGKSCYFALNANGPKLKIGKTRLKMDGDGITEAKTLKLWMPHSYRRMPKEARLKYNGCGAEGAVFDFVPDTAWGLDISEACRIHDHMYELGADMEDLFWANWFFYLNLRLIIIQKTRSRVLKFFRLRRVRKYFWAVFDFGLEPFLAGKDWAGLGLFKV